MDSLPKKSSSFDFMYTAKRKHKDNTERHGRFFRKLGKLLGCRRSSLQD